MNMRLNQTNNLFYLLLISIIISSCAVKTFTVSEENGFSSTKYDISLDRMELKKETKEEQKKLLEIAEKLIDSSNLKIMENKDLVLNRDYLKINDSIIVEYLSYLPTNSKRTIIFFIGNQSRQTSYVKLLQQLSVETNSKIFSWNYRGYGNSNGNPSFKTQFDDNQNIFSQLLGNDRDEELIFIGYSLGTVFSSKLASSEQPDKLILLAPFSDIPDMYENYKRQLTRGIKIFYRPYLKLKVKEEYVKNISNVDEVNKFKGNLLIIHSKNDKQLPYSMGKKIYESSNLENKKLITLKKGGHGAPLIDKNWNKMIEWIKNGL